MKELLNGNPKLIITVIGIGGCGCNTVNMLHANKLSEQVNLVAVNTDLAALNSLSLENKILIGENLTNGYGAGSDPAIGYQAAQESEDLLRNLISDSDIVIITAGFGGGTGTGATPLIAKITRELDINCLAIVTLPFESEGPMRMAHALQGIEDIKEPINAYITLSNDLLLAGLGESVGLFSAFNKSNKVLKNLLLSLVQMLNKTGYVNVDKNDFSTILSYGGESILGVGKADTEEQAFVALDQALNNPLVSLANIASAKGIIFQLFCKSEPKLSTYNGLIEKLRSKITNSDVLIVPGVTLDPTLSCEIEILIIGSGLTNDETKAVAEVNIPDEQGQVIVQNVAITEVEYIGNEVNLHDQVENMTDIPAITRKLMANSGN